MLLQAGAKIDGPRAQVHRSSCTPLHCAAMGGHMTVAMRLLEARPGLISIKDTKGKTPAWWAARRGHTVLAATLRALEAKAADAKAAGAGSSLSNGSATVKKYQVAPTAESREAGGLGCRGRSAITPRSTDRPPRTEFAGLPCSVPIRIAGVCRDYFLMEM